MRTQEILKTLKELKTQEIQLLNNTLKSIRQYNAWNYIYNKFQISPFTDSQIITILKQLPRNKRYTIFQTHTEPKEGNKYSKFIVDKSGNGVEVIYEYKYKLIDMSSDDWGDDYYTGIGIRKETNPNYEWQLKPEIIKIKEAKNIEIPYNQEFIYIPDFNEPKRKPKKADFSRLKEIEKLINALSKLPKDTDLYFKIQINNPENPEEIVKLIIDFNKEKLLYHKVDIDEYWEYADYEDFSEEMKIDMKVAERVGQKAIKSIKNGIIPDFNKLIREERNNIEMEQNREQLIEEGMRLADEEVIERIDKEYKQKIKQLLIGQKVRVEVRYFNRKLQAGETITEHTDEGIFKVLFIFPHKYLSDKEIADKVSELWEERKQKLDEYYISLALDRNKQLINQQ